MLISISRNLIHRCDWCGVIGRMSAVTFSFGNIYRYMFPIFLSEVVARSPLPLRQIMPFCCTRHTVDSLYAEVTQNREWSSSIMATALRKEHVEQLLSILWTGESNWRMNKLHLLFASTASFDQNNNSNNNIELSVIPSKEW